MQLNNLSFINRLNFCTNFFNEQITRYSGRVKIYVMIVEDNIVDNYPLPLPLKLRLRNSNNLKTLDEYNRPRNINEHENVNVIIMELEGNEPINCM